MNILPKKRWHVRTKENIARVKQDEAKYDEEQRQIKYRAQLAEQESRTELLRKQIALGGSTTAIETFRAPLLSERSVELLEGNKEYEAEKRAEKEAQEKSIGLLTYLGQSVLESSGQRPWYDVHPKRQSTSEQEKNKAREEWEAKKKSRADPLFEMNKISEWFEKRREEKAREENQRLRRANSCITAMPSLFPNDIAVPKTSTKRTASLLESLSLFKQSLKQCKNKKRKKHKHASSDEGNKDEEPDMLPGCLVPGNTVVAGSSCVVSEVANISKQQRLDALRAERLQRERKERERAALVMAEAMGLTDALRDPCESEQTTTDERELPFNSAFNPELAAVLAERRRKFRDSRKRPYP
ncbi:unnamed protein product [Dicrocoelium dendriticum]|nr:unnamed protein product [Dicrocoelium dendriticum]